jgi:uncharacterized protein DUF5995
MAMNRIASSAVRVTAGLVAALAVALGSPAGARAEDPLFVPWMDLLPGIAAPYDPADPNVCRAGKVQCVDATIREMQRRFAPLVTSCDHDAVFALAYLRTTQAYRLAVDDPAFFDDNGFVNHEDALFASMYFKAYDDWHAGRLADVPRAWAIAFQTSRDRTDRGAGDLLLGMNAHVNRDLPFALYAVGLVARDGTSRKPDHNKVNVILNHVEGPLIAEIAQRLDPSVDDVGAPGTLDETALLQLLFAWREDAWRNAERLAAAPTAADRALVASSIEDQAAAEAATIMRSNAYAPLVESSAARDAYCAVHHG